MSEKLSMPRKLVAAASLAGLITAGAVVRNEISGSEPAKVSANELAQIQSLRDPEVRAEKQANRTFVPIAGGDVFAITITDDEGKPEQRLVHLTRTDENASTLAERYGVPGEVGYFQDQGSRVVGDNGHELMTADPVLLPRDAHVEQK